MNHALHAGARKFSQKKTQEINNTSNNGDCPDCDYSKLSPEQAETLYQSRKGGIVSVDLSKIDFRKTKLIERVSLNDDGKTYYRIRLAGRDFANWDDAVVHGTITVEKVEGYNLYQVAIDPELGCRCGKFNFEMHSIPTNNVQSFFRTIFRNIETWYGERVFGTNYMGEYKSGSPFTIEYKGTAYIYGH